MHNQAKSKLSIDIAKLVLLSFCVFLMSACGAFEIGIEHVAPGGRAREVNWQATAETLQVDATRRSSTQGNESPLLVVEAAPTIVPLVVPDANRQPVVAYVLGGDIWTKELPDGEATRLTHDGHNQEPRWSASGEWLSFIKYPERPELWVMRKDGSDAGMINLIGTNAYAWSPTEDKLAYGIDGTLVVLHFYETEVGAAQRLATQVQLGQPGGNAPIGEVAWSSTGQEIAFTLWSVTVGTTDNDGLWIVDVNGNLSVHLLESELPEKGQYILHGWSGDDAYLIYSQSSVLSASILSDGVPLYRVPALGGTPEMIAESVIPLYDFVQSQPNGLSLVAFIAGSGREVWHNKHLRSVVVSGSQAWELTPSDQAASSPAWSPAGDLIAYVGMPDVAVEGADGVVGGQDAQAALNLRQIWLAEPDSPEPHPIQEASAYREEAPVWIDDETILFARIDMDGRVSLWQMTIAGENELQVVEEITPAPEWFGYYGHIDWQSYFSLWRPRTVAQNLIMELPPTAVPPMPLAPTESSARTLSNFLQAIHPALTSDEVMAWFGMPDAVSGSGLLIYQYNIGDRVQIWLAFPGAGPLTYAQLRLPDGKAFELSPLPFDPAQMPPTATPTPFPSVLDLNPLEMTPTPVPMISPLEEPGPTPTPIMPPTATPVPTAPKP